MYIKRHIENVLNAAIKEKGALCVTGARQAGKSTVLQNVFTKHKSLTLDDNRLLGLALSRPEEFFDIYGPPVFIDEIQYAPSLFPFMKIHIDKTGAKGAFVLSGSQRFEMMSNVTESLAGRINLIDLYGLSLREIYNDDFNEAFMPTHEYLNGRNPKLIGQNEIWDNIWRGFFPEMAVGEMDWARFYSSYIRTYLDRDVSRLGQVGDLAQFERFMTATAARTGQLLNIADVAKDAGINRQTAEKWLSLLVSSNIVYVLKPYYINVLKRLVKTPKIYYLDTGLACYLIGWDNARVLQNGAMSGAMFETFVIGEIIKSWANFNGVTPNMNFYFYRDLNGGEIDLLIKRNGNLYPVEIKKHKKCSADDIAAFARLDGIPGINRGEGCVVCMSDDVFPITKNVSAVGVNYI